MDDPAAPKPGWVLNQKSFDTLLSWLGRNREEAGEKYENIRSALIKRFDQLGCSELEELTNETIDRVAKKLPQILETYIGEPEPYFFSVAYYVYKEHLRRPVLMSLADTEFPDSSQTDEQELFDKELIDSCLQHCLEQLDQNNREMITEYYRGERKEKIKSRNALAERLGIKVTNLRLRAQRVRVSLRECILDCMEIKTAKRGTST